MLEAEVGQKPDSAYWLFAVSDTNISKVFGIMKSCIFVSKQKAMARRSSPIDKGNTVQVNLMKSDVITEEQWQEVKKTALALELEGIGDGSKHNTLLYILAETLNLPTDGIFAEEKSGDGFILYMPKKLSAEIEKEGKRYGIRKDEAISTLIDIWIRKNKNNSSKNEMGELKSTTKTEKEMEHYMTIEEFLVSNPKRGPVTRVGYNDAVRRGVIVPEDVPVIVMKKMIDTRKFGVTDSGGKRFYRKDGK